jgi:NitT/TauT family transport system permease protein
MTGPSETPSLLQRFAASGWFRYFLYSVSIVLFVGMWHALSWRLNETDPVLATYIPYPVDVAKAFIASFSSPIPGPDVYIWTLISASLKRVLLGFAIALAIALPIGLLMGAFKTVECLGKPVVELIRPIPPIAWAPVFLFAFKAFWGPIAVVFVGAFFPLLINIIFGVRSVDPMLIDAARTLGANKRHLFTKVIVPSTLPYLMTGVKVALGIAWMCIVAAEMLPVRGGGGLGYAIWTITDIGRWDYIFAIMLFIGILSILTTGLAGEFERRVYKWMGMK